LGEHPLRASETKGKQEQTGQRLCEVHFRFSSTGTGLPKHPALLSQHSKRKQEINTKKKASDRNRKGDIGASEKCPGMPRRHDRCGIVTATLAKRHLVVEGAAPYSRPHNLQYVINRNHGKVNESRTGISMLYLPHNAELPLSFIFIIYFQSLNSCRFLENSSERHPRHAS
jgi:hypothetical protein